MNKNLTKLLLALLAVSALFVTACGDDTEDSTSDADENALTGTATVSAAASLTEAFTQIGEDFSAANPDATVEFTFDSSSTLSQQIIDGAPVDVYASADEANMTKLTDADLIAGSPEVFATNELVIVTKPGNPEGITGLADLADAGVISLCGEEVPCGKFAKEALDNAGVTIPETSVTRGQNVKATLTAVTESDAVAGIVYVTDAQAAGDAVDTVTIPADQNVVAVYPIGVLGESTNTELAEAFMAYVLSPQGQSVLAEFGFQPPA